jgi:hypothetical protein
MTRLALGPTQPSIEWILGFSPWVKKPGYDIINSPPSNAAIRKSGTILLITSTCLHGVDREKSNFFKYYFDDQIVTS